MARSFFFQVCCHEEGQEVSCVTSARGSNRSLWVTVSGSAYLLLTLHFWLCQYAGEKYKGGGGGGTDGEEDSKRKKGKERTRGDRQ